MVWELVLRETSLRSFRSPLEALWRHRWIEPLQPQDHQNLSTGPLQLQHKRCPVGLNPHRSDWTAGNRTGCLWGPLSRCETHNPVHGSSVNLIKLPNEETHVLGTSIKLFHVLMSFLWWKECLLWWIMIIRHKIWYVHINIYMRINMLHI